MLDFTFFEFDLSDWKKLDQVTALVGGTIVKWYFRSTIRYSALSNRKNRFLFAKRNSPYLDGVSATLIRGSNKWKYVVFQINCKKVL